MAGYICDLLGSGVTRRDVLRLMGRSAVAGLAGLSFGRIAGASVHRPSDMPNIIFILSDNCRWDCMGFMGHPFIKTPGLDRLAKEGVVFENAFNTTSLCSPSRASILTGTYAHTHGVLNNHTPWTGKLPTFMEYLKNAGYDTAFIGKWHMPGRGLPNLPYLDLFVSYTYREGQGSYFNCPLIVNGKPEPSLKPYITEEVTRRAIDFMTKTKTGGSRLNRPFFIYLSHRTAHPPFQAPDDISGMYDKDKVVLPKVVDSWFSRTNGNVYQGIMMGSYEDQYRKYCEDITAMDREIQHLLDVVERLGMTDNTVVIYMSDNGMMWGEHRCHGIKYPYEESIRVPLIVRCPWLVNKPGTSRSQMALNIDIAPTILDLAGIKIPSFMEGRSLVSVIRDANLPWRDAFLLEYWKYYPENLPSYKGVRTNRFKYVEYEKTLGPQIFDLKEDPKEYNNLYGTARGEGMLPELKRLLAELDT